jgi:transposase
MRPYGTSEQLACRRQRARDLRRHGMSPQQVARRLGVTARSVRRWQHESKRLPRKRAARGPGHPCRLTASQLQRLERALGRGAGAHGYAEDYWTLKRIAQLIGELFQVRYRPSGVWYLLQRLGWSSQKPQRRTLQRDDAAIAHWKHYVWPQIRKQWQTLSATLIFLDESGFSLVSPLKRTWAPRGQTPTTRTSINHHERLNLIGAVRVSPRHRKIKLHIHSYGHSISGDEVIAFLEHLLQRIVGPIVLVWDRHPIHRRRKVQDFLARHPRLHVYEFPTSAPELNPAEGIWTQVDEYTASTAPHNGLELQANVLAGVARTRSSSARLWACIFASDLPWKR